MFENLVDAYCFFMDEEGNKTIADTPNFPEFVDDLQHSEQEEDLDDWEDKLVYQGVFIYQ